MEKLETLRHYFGHNAFRAGQETLVDALLSGRDTLGVMPTGAGKSICYQVPALMLPGVTLVISPLISLMADQVAALKAAGVPAAYLNSSLTPRQMDLALQRAREGAYRIIYVAPERLETSVFRTFARNAPIRLIAVDEAHCVSQWGQDFRPDYLRIADFIAALPHRPAVGAFTATATERVRQDIIRHLHLVNPVSITTGFDRPNLYFEVVRVQKNRETALLRLLENRRGQSGIIYCATRKQVEETCFSLQTSGFSASRYHAGLSDEERRVNQEDFQFDRVQIMVATNAFGMGIDKSNVRFVMHYNIPKSMEAYYQEAGRAGRDGERADCLLLYNASDIFTCRWMVDNSPPNPDLSAAEQRAVRTQDHQRLQQMIEYCTRDTCLRSYILRYFGEAPAADCGDCGHCTGGRFAWAATAPAPKQVKSPAVAHRAAVKPTPVPSKIDAPGGDLFDQLKEVRLALAKAAHLPPYIIATDATLSDMVRRKPQTMEGMRSVSGMGDVKVAKYGQAFLDMIKPYVAKEKRMRQQAAAIARDAQNTPMHPTKKAVKSSNIPPTLPPGPTAPSPALQSYARVLTRPDAAPDDDTIQDAYLSGRTIQQIAAQLDVEPAVIRQRLQDMDLIF